VANSKFTINIIYLSSLMHTCQMGISFNLLW